MKVINCRNLLTENIQISFSYIIFLQIRRLIQMIYFNCLQIQCCSMSSKRWLILFSTRECCYTKPRLHHEIFPTLHSSRWCHSRWKNCPNSQSWMRHSKIQYFHPCCIDIRCPGQFCHEWKSSSANPTNARRQCRIYSIPAKSKAIITFMFYLNSWQKLTYFSFILFFHFPDF